MESIISILLALVAVYLLLGLLFSIFFLWKGLAKVDPATKGSGLFFKLLIFPGMCAFWVFFLLKWLKVNKV